MEKQCGGESVSQSPLKDKAFSSFLDQNPPLRAWLTLKAPTKKPGVLYRAMVLLRLFDRKAVALQRTGRLGTYAVSLGQEAVSVGIASAMRE
jgi:Dehydrogenase E1 component